MLSVGKISLTQFKNYQSASFHFTERIVGICGKNGAGKTNLLDAVHYLCFTRSYFSKTDSANARIGTFGFRLEAELDKQSGKHRIVCILRETGKKEFSMDDDVYGKLSKHIGKFTCVMIAPDDIALVTDGSEERRKFLDTIISQIDEVYLQQLISYNKILQQRNSLLKLFADTGNKDLQLLEVLNKQLKIPCEYIYEKRKHFMHSFIPLVKEFYEKIADHKERCGLAYESQLNNRGFDELLKLMFEKDLALQRTNVGIHKDDIDFLLNDHSFKTIASQGQRKSLLFALKLAEFEILKKEKGFAPLLLLDDVFEKLDDNRMHNLLDWVCNENDGQVFITDTHEERLNLSLSKLKQPFQLIELMNNE